MKITAFGENAWLVTTDDPIGLWQRIDATHLEEVVPGAGTVLLRGEEHHVSASLAQFDSAPPRRLDVSVVTLDVVWDGPDLGDVARDSGMSADDVVAALRRITLTVEFCGFAPGFGYMTGLPEQLHLPRRPRPRPAVAPGSVAIAAGYCSVYPTASPGGWHLLGTCATVLFDPGADQPALLAPGTRVRLR